MDRLSSCYFCGAALDAQLSEYPVVPRRLQSEGTEGKTVVLCDGCRHKLGTILEPVVEAVEGHSTEIADYEGTDFESIDGSANGEELDGQPLHGEVDDDPNEEGDGIDTVSTAGSQPERSTDSETAHSASDTDAGGSAGSGGSQPADDGTDGDSDGPSLTRLEYNKVMRLLQHRESPVDRAEIREVATSAYQLAPEEFDRVIDAAIDRGLIAEENGQFVEADGR